MKRSAGVPCAYGPRKLNDPSASVGPRSKVMANATDSASDAKGGSNSARPRCTANNTPDGGATTVNKS